MIVAAILAVTGEQIGVGTVSGLLIAFSAGVFKVYGQAQDDRKESAEARVKALEEELDRAHKSAEASDEKWAARVAALEHNLELARQELRDCWQSQLDKRMNDDH